MMPSESHHSVAQAVMMFIGDAILDLLLDPSIPAYNLYALQRLSSDVQQLKAFAEASGIPHMAVSLCPTPTPSLSLPLDMSAFPQHHLCSSALCADLMSS